MLVPGSCSTGAAWRPIIAQWEGRYRCVTTSLSGYGGTAERRTARDPSIVHEAEILETVIRRAGGRAHVVAHSFGGIVALAVALRKRVTLASLVIAEAPAAELLRSVGEHEHYQAFRDMTEAYFDAFCDGDTEAIGTMIDFYGGAGTFDSWPARVRDYAVATTSVNIRDWATVYSFPLSPSLLAAIDVPALVLWGGDSHPAVQRANQLLGQCLEGASCGPVDGAAHFMISTHAQDVARRVADHIDRVQRNSRGEPPALGLVPRVEPRGQGRAFHMPFDELAAWSPPPAPKHAASA